MVQESLSPSMTQVMLFPLPIQSRAVTRMQQPMSRRVVIL